MTDSGPKGITYSFNPQRINLNDTGTANLDAINNRFYLAFIGTALVSAVASSISLFCKKSNR